MPSAQAWVRAWPWFAAAALLVILDQVTKWLIAGAFRYGELREVTGFFNLVLVYNKGAAFSFLADAPGWQQPVLVTFALAAAVFISFFIARNTEKKIFCAGLTLILGGAVGNVIDRLRFGHVVDFLDFHAFGWHWPAFNVADSGITVGAILLILEGFIHHEKRADAPT